MSRPRHKQSWTIRYSVLWVAYRTRDRPAYAYFSVLGVTEAGLFPGVIYLFSVYYRRHERSWRVAIFFGGAALAGAFGGEYNRLLTGSCAEGLFKVSSLMRLGKWMELVVARAGNGAQALLTIHSTSGWLSLSFQDFYYRRHLNSRCLPGGVLCRTYLVAQSKICQSVLALYEDIYLITFQLTEADKKRLLERLSADSDAGLIEKFEWVYVRQALTDHLVWGYALLFHGFAFVLYSLSLFLVRLFHWIWVTCSNFPLKPTIIAGLGFATWKAQLWYKSPYISSSIN